MRRAALAPSAVAVLAGALLSGAAAFTVAQAGCADPGHYVQHEDGYELVGGCIEPGDLPVGPGPVIEVGTDNARP